MLDVDFFYSGKRGLQYRVFRTFVFCEKWKKYEIVLVFFQTSDRDITPISFELKNVTLNTYSINC